MVPPRRTYARRMLFTLVRRTRESFWFLPAVFGVVAIVLAQVLVTVDRQLIGSGVSLPFLDELSASGGRSILTSVGGSMLTVAGTSFSITISVLATTSSTYGPRLVRNFLADRANQFVLAMFTSTFLYTITVLRSVHTDIDDSDAFVPVLAVHVAVLIAVVDVGVLVFFIHHIAQSVQVTTLQRRVQGELEEAIDVVYPAEFTDRQTRRRSDVAEFDVPVPSTADGYIERVDLEGLARWADRHDAVVRVLAMPGDHVIPGDALVVLSGGGDPDAAAKAVRAAYSLEIERTTSQDVRFALQQLMEMGVRGLASGTNDPYTAVSSIDLAAHPIITAAMRPAPPCGMTAGDGRVVVTYLWPDPEVLVADAFGSLRTYGLEHPSVVEAGVRLAERLCSRLPEGRLHERVKTELAGLWEAWVEDGPFEPDVARLQPRVAELGAV